MWQVSPIRGYFQQMDKDRGGTTNSITVTVGANNGTITVTPSNSCGNGTAKTLGLTTTTVFSQPSTVTGSTSPCLSSSQTYRSQRRGSNL